MGSGTVWLNGSSPNTYTGTTTVNQGYLYLYKSTNIVAVPGPLVINGGTVYLDNNGQIAATSNVTLNAGTWNLQGYATTVNNLVVNGGTITGYSDYGPGSIAIGGALTIAGGSIGSGPTITVGAITVPSSNSSPSIAAQLNLSGTRALDIARGSGTIDLTIGGSITSGGIVKTDTGTLLLAGNNSTLSGLTVTGGQVVVSNSNGLGTGSSPIIVGDTAGTAAASLLVAGTTTLPRSVTVQAGSSGTLTLGGNGTYGSGTGTFAGGITLNNNVTLLATGGENVIVSGAISGTGNITVMGSGTVTLNGSVPNTSGSVLVKGGNLTLSMSGGAVALSGDLTIGDGASASTVTLGAAGQLPSTTNVTINTLGSLATGGNSTAVNSLSVNGGSITASGSVTVNGPLNFTGGSSTCTLVAGGDITTSAAASAVTLSGTLTLPTNRTFNVARGSAAIDLDIPATVIGAAVIMNGPGIMRLSASNTFTGGLTLNAGTVAFGNNNAAGTGAIIFNGGTVQSDTAARTLPNVYTAFGSLTIGGTLDFTLSGSGTLNGPWSLTCNNPGNTTLSGNLAEASPGQSLVKAGPGTLHLLGSNTFTGGVQLLGGTLAVGNDAALGTGPLTLTAGILQADGSAHTLPNSSTWGPTLTFGGTLNLTMAGSVSLPASTTITVSNTGVTTIAGNIQESNAGTSITEAGAGTLVLKGTNAFSGGFTQTAGILGIGGNAVLGSGVFTFSGGSMQASGGPQTVGNSVVLAANLAVSGGQILTFGGPLTLTSSQNISDDVTTSVVVTGAIGQDASVRTLTKSGLGSLTLAGGNTFTGGLTLSAGILVIANNAAAGTGTLTLAGGTILAGSSPQTLPNPVVVSGAVIIGGAQNLTFSGTTTINAALTVNNTATTSLSGSVATGGSITLNAGTLVGTSLQLGGTFTLNGGVFQGTLTNLGTFTVTGGSLNGHLSNQGTFTFSGSPTFTNGIDNFGSFTCAAGQTLTVNGTGLFNYGTVTITGGTLAGATVTNDFAGQLNGKGTISAALINNGSMTNTGLLTVTGMATNYGTITTGSTQTLQLAGGLANYGTVTLNQGSLSGGGGVTNMAGGTIQGGGGIYPTVTNSGGLIVASAATPLVITDLTGGNVAGGELLVSTTLRVLSVFTSSGTINLTGNGAALLTGGAITNTGLITGSGEVANAVANSGTIRPVGQLMFSAAPNTNAVGGQIQVPTGGTALYVQGLPANNGTITLTGGTLDTNSTSLTNGGTINGQGVVRAGSLTNNNRISIAGGATQFYGTVTNNGSLTVTATTAIFYGDFTNGSSGTIVNTSGMIQYLGNFASAGGARLPSRAGRSSLAAA